MNESLIALLRRELLLLTWRDGVEVLFFFLLFYTLIRWLARSKKPDLLMWWYGYAALFGSAYCLDMVAVALFLEKILYRSI